MKTLQELKLQIPDYAKDVKTNLENLFNEKNSVLVAKNTFGAALSAAYATKEKSLIQVMENESQNYLSSEEISAVKTAVVMMAMNNSYYCFTHVSADKEYLEMPVGLVMASIKNPKINKADFEVFALSASIINSCSICIDSHQEKLFRDGFSRKEIQAVAQIASVMASLAQILVIQNQ
ncbi:MAG: carboxymuconolactone decarboxylase family protein [Proteobacteria bacterium]|nr:carboxymuconolactone decarboxylase family protein [Pseudomonadota bacterium]